MTEEQIIKLWRSGLTVLQVANRYLKDYNKLAKKRKESCIKREDAQKYIEPIIYEFETKDWKKG